MEKWNNEEMRDLKEKIEREGLSGNVELQLETLNKKFADFQKDWASKEEEERESKEWYFWANRVYNQIGEKYTAYLLELEGGEEVMEIETQKVEKFPEQMQYQNYQQIMKPILELEQLHMVTYQDFSRIIDAIQLTITEGKKFDTNMAWFTNTIIAIISSKLDELSKSIWEFQLETEEPSLDMLVEFLTKRIRHIRHSEGAIATTSKGLSPTMPRGKRLCIYCGSAVHTIFKCTIFGGLSLEAKEQFIVVKEKRCANCFQNTHKVDQCFRGKCNRCQIKHNSLMCKKNPNNF